MKKSYFHVAAGLLSGLFAWGLGYHFHPALDSRSALGDQVIAQVSAPLPQDASPSLAVRPDGAALYVSACQSCHQPDGRGRGRVFPPLAGADWVVGDSGALILITLLGMTGPIDVNGQRYNSFMPGFRAQFDDAALADVLTHIRASWGNAADAITPAEVGRHRRETAHLSEPWRGQEALAAYLAGQSRGGR